jgi:diaminopimelate decarboxylase
MTDRPPYERPVLLRHAPGHMNKFSRVGAMRPATHIDGVAVADLVEQYGSPLFVFSERTLRSRYRELHDALTRRWSPVRIAWSYKTNYNAAICQVFHQEGAWAEVVSGLEYDKARAHGVPGSRIHFNGPLKPRPVLTKALREGATVHIDNFDELTLAEKIAQEDGVDYGVALRVNLQAEGVAAWSRFGFNLESGQARDAAMRLLTGGHLRLTGFHCHLGTFLLDPAAYREAAGKLRDLANDLRREHGVTLDFIDLGGGFASQNTLRDQYLPGAQATPALSRYVEAISEGLAGLDHDPGKAPTLVVETGRALVDDAGSLIVSVVANKRLPDGRRGVVLDGGVNLLFTAFWYRHDVVPAQPFRGMPEPTVLYGPLCMNIDVMRDTMAFPPVEPGDKLVFRTVGAYNLTQWMQFITARPAVVMIGRDGRHGLIRRAEDVSTLLDQEEMPDWLDG